MSAHANSFDLIVIGGGPGGATLGSLVAMQGGRVLLLERDTFPRYQVGESLMVSTVQGICRILGVSGILDQAGFIRKPGGVFRWGEGSDLWTLSFTQANQLRSKDFNYAYHVERSRFDQILLDSARGRGVVVLEGANVEALLESEGRVIGVTYRTTDGATVDAHARFVADASGSSSQLFSAAGQRVFSRFFRNIALFGYFYGADRLPTPLEGGGITEAFPDGWMWFLPLTDRLTSVGMVIGAEQAQTLRGNRYEALRRSISACQHIDRLLSRSTLVAEGPYGVLRVRSDFSYTNERFWRPGLVLVGDSACFLDPLFTTGVHFATYAGLLAARSINSVLTANLDETAAFEEFEYRYRLEFELFYHYVVAYYDMHDDNGGLYWRTRKVTCSPESENNEFVRLLTNGRDQPDEYFGSKRGIGKKAQEFVNLLKQANDPQRHIALSRRMAEHLFTAFQPPSGPRPFHLGFEDIRLMSWGRNSDLTTRLPPGKCLAPSPDGFSWQRQ